MKRRDPIWIVLLLGACGSAPDDAAPSGTTAGSTGMVVTQGAADRTGPCSVTRPCESQGNVREALCGEITAPNGSLWALPAPISDGATAVDVYNECTAGGHNGRLESELAEAALGEGESDVTAYLFGDNYFELYVNGRYLARDAIGFTPFNSHAVRYRTDYPITYAVLAVDWEGYLGIGLEDMRDSMHIGDGGFIAAFSDGAVTGDDWKCNVYYIAPLDDPDCVSVDERGIPDSTGCPSKDDVVTCRTNDPTRTCRAAHFPLPENWMSAGFDDSHWPAATTYTADQVTRSPGFRDYQDTLFRGASFIWTGNLDLDNLVVCRATIDAPPGDAR